MSEVELKPCPFCGDQPWITEMTNGAGFDLYCANTSCGFSYPIQLESYEEAKRIWNTRHEAAKEDEQDIAGSSSGRTADFESVNEGSIPSPASSDEPINPTVMPRPGMQFMTSSPAHPAPVSDQSDDCREDFESWWHEIKSSSMRGERFTTPGEAAFAAWQAALATKRGSGEQKCHEALAALWLAKSIKEREGKTIDYEVARATGWLMCEAALKSTKIED